jgi:hypothetical protein
MRPDSQLPQPRLSSERASLWANPQVKRPLKARRPRWVKPLFELFCVCDALQLVIEQVIRPESATELVQYKRRQMRLQ